MAMLGFWASTFFIQTIHIYLGNWCLSALVSRSPSQDNFNFLSMSSETLGRIAKKIGNDVTRYKTSVGPGMLPLHGIL